MRDGAICFDEIICNSNVTVCAWLSPILLGWLCRELQANDGDKTVIGQDYSQTSGKRLFFMDGQLYVKDMFI